MQIKINVNLRVGRVVKYFVLADLFLLAGWGLLEPVFSVFIVQRVQGATLATVGIAAAIYWILKSLLQLPIANYLDRRPGESDDFHFLIAGLLIGSFSAFAFSLVQHVWQLYLVQVLHAVAFAIYIPSWSGMFSRHLDKDRASFDWSLDSTVAGLAAGTSGFLSGMIAKWLGFSAVFMLAALFSMGAALVLLMAPELILPKKTSSAAVMRDHTPKSIDQ